MWVGNVVMVIVYSISWSILKVCSVFNLEHTALQQSMKALDTVTIQFSGLQQTKVQSPIMD